MIIDKIKEYFEDIYNGNTIKIDFLGNKPSEYVIEPIPTNPNLRPYTDGSNLKQYTFQFSSREYFDSDTLTNLENSSFYETFSDTIEQNNKNRNLPDIDGIQSIECLNIGTIQSEQDNTAKYSIQLRITYKK